ncbi:MAG: 2OG-Fe(II) oxygenase [Methylocella sp.]
MGINILPDVAESLDKDPQTYSSADPFPHIVIDNFLPQSVIDTLVDEFPDPRNSIWNERMKDAYQVKLASNNVDSAPPSIRDVLYQLNSATTLRALEKLTGEGPLISDPYFDGGGMHQIERGGRLVVHADFTRPRHLPIFRRLNLLLYLNKEWEASFGGCLELWSCDCKKKVKEVAPVANRVVIFTTATTSYHGHPTPLTCPPDRARRSLALYYYSVEPPKRAHTGTTTRWRRDTGARNGARQRAAAFLWRVSRKLGDIASRLE